MKLKKQLKKGNMGESPTERRSERSAFFVAWEGGPEHGRRNIF
jgi:hypothetical protein